MAKTKDSALVPVERIAHSILLLRGQRVIIDRDLAAIYGVSTGRLNEAVKRNPERFPADFMFRLTREEAERSRSQIAILKNGRGYNVKPQRAYPASIFFLSFVTSVHVHIASLLWP